jgi:hypothetical protein
MSFFGPVITDPDILLGNIHAMGGGVAILKRLWPRFAELAPSESFWSVDPRYRCTLVLPSCLCNPLMARLFEDKTHLLPTFIPISTKDDTFL